MNDVKYERGAAVKTSVVVVPGGRVLHYWRARAWSRVGVVIVIVLLIIIVCAVVSTRYEGDVYISATHLSPGDTRLVSPSSVLCESTTLNNPASTVSATVFLLHRKPLLSSRYNFTISDNVRIAYEGYQYWSFYMYPGSSYTLSSCLTSGSVGHYVIKGKRNFDSWVNSFFTSESNALHYNDPCSGANRTTEKIFTSEDQYYFVFYNTFYTASNIHITLAINIAGYLPHSGGVMDSCTAPPTSSCTLAIPYDSDFTLLVETSPPSDGRWEANVNVGTTCNPRVWVYVLSVLMPLLGVAAIATVIIITVYCCVKGCSFRKDVDLSTQKMSSTVPVSSDVVILQQVNEQKVLSAAEHQLSHVTCGEHQLPPSTEQATWLSNPPPPAYSATSN